MGLSLIHIFVVLHQAVIRILRKGDRGQFQRIDNREGKELELRKALSKHGYIVSQQIVTDDEAGALCQRIELLGNVVCLRHIRHDDLAMGIRAPCRDFANVQCVVCSSLDIEAETLGRKGHGPVSYTHLAHGWIEVNAGSNDGG